MATKTKAPVRTGAGKGGRRPPVKVKRGREVPILPIAVAVILLVFAVGVIIYTVVNNKSTAPQSAAGIPCDSLQHSQVHYHAAIQIVYQGAVHPIPSNIGIVTDSTGAVTCYYWLHVHAANPNVIHIESPANQTFTLGQFFQIWGQPLSATQLLNSTVDADHKITATVNGTPFTGDPASIPLADRETIVLQYGPPFGTPTKSIFEQ